MEWILPFVLVLIITGGTVFLFMHLTRSHLHGGLKLIQDSFESLQRNLLLSQKEFERSQDERSLNLRDELSRELQSNRRELQEGLKEGTLTLDTKFGSIDTRLDKRLQDLTESVSSNLEANLKEGFIHFSKVQESLKKAEEQLSNLNTVGQSINDLNSLLKLPHLRGGFGESTLERLLSDLLPRDSFELQYRIVPSSTERVDAVIKYPNQVLPIDSKFPREQVLPLFETQDPEKLSLARDTLCTLIKNLAKQIKDKYIHPEHGTVDMALLFVPSETLYFEMLRNTKLCDELGRLKVFAVSPNTLAVTLHAVSMARDYYEMAKDVENTISDLKKAKQHFENFERRFDEIGTSLGKAQSAFNICSTHLSRYTGAIQRLSGPDESFQNHQDALPAPG